MRACQLLGSSDRLDYSDCSNLFHVLSACRVFHQSPSIRYALLGSIQAITRLRGEKVSGVALTKQHRAIGVGWVWGGGTSCAWIFRQYNQQKDEMSFFCSADPTPL